MSFLGYLIQARPPLSLGMMLIIFITNLKLEVHFLKATRVMPCLKFTPTSQVSGGIFLHGGNTEIK